MCTWSLSRSSYFVAMRQSEMHIYLRQVRKFFQDTKCGMMSGRLKLGLADAISLTTIIQFPYRALSREPRAPDPLGYGNSELHVDFSRYLTSGDQQGKEKRSTCPTLKPLVTSAAINPPGYHNLLGVFPSS